MSRQVSQLGFNEKKYLLALTNPFHEDCVGVKSPDDYSFPTATAVCRDQTTYSRASSEFNAAAFFPTLGEIVLNPATVNNATSAIAWNAGSTVTSGDYNGLASVAEMYRIVAWGLRISVVSAASSTTGQICLSHVPVDVVSHADGWNFFPATFAENVEYPISALFGAYELLETPLVVPGRMVDAGVHRFRDVAFPVAGPASLETSYGWAAIVATSDSGVASTDQTYNIESIIHIEYIPKGLNSFSSNGSPSPYHMRSLQSGVMVQQALPVGYIENLTGISGEAWLSKIMTAGASIADAYVKTDSYAGMGQMLLDNILGRRRKPSKSLITAGIDAYMDLD